MFAYLFVQLYTPTDNSCYDETSAKIHWRYINTDANNTRLGVVIDLRHQSCYVTVKEGLLGRASVGD